MARPINKPSGRVMRNTTPSRPFKPSVLQATIGYAGAIMLPNAPPVVCAAMSNPASQPAGPARCPPEREPIIKTRTPRRKSAALK